MVNDSPRKKANVIMKKLEIVGHKHLCLFASKDIGPNEELRYDYGVSNLPCRRKDKQLFLLKN
jgi:SET domain-containing protein